MINYYKGLCAEYISALFLQLKGYKILRRRFKTKIGEIDLICRKNNLVVFLEVKSRADKQVFFDVLTYKQQSRIRNAASLYLQRYQDSPEVRFDVIFISLPCSIKHIKNAF